jgi:hypothetical protein
MGSAHVNAANMVGAAHVDTADVTARVPTGMTATVVLGGSGSGRQSK